MVIRIKVCIGISLAGFVLAVGVRLWAQEAPAPSAGSPRSNPNAVSAPAAPYGDVVKRYCVSCHNERLATAGLMLDTLDVASVGTEHAAVWEKVIRKLRTRQMPPAGLPRPDSATYTALAAYLEAKLDAAAAAHPNPGRRAAFHRLNRLEYSNAVRDLLAIEVDAASLLPADDAGHGFDNVAEMLSISPRSVEGYLTAARRVSRLTVGDLKLGPVTESYGVSRSLRQDERVSDNLPFGSRGGVAIRQYFPLDAEYLIKIRLQRTKDNYVFGLGEPHRLDVRIDGVLVKQFTVGGEHRGRAGAMHTIANPNLVGEPEQERYEFTADAGLEVRLAVKAGPRVVGVAFLKDSSEPESEIIPTPTFDEINVGGYKGGEPAVDGVAISGPYHAHGVGDTPSRRRIFVCRPTSGGEEESCAERILSRLARTAFRRPVTREDVDSLLGFFRSGRREEGFDSGIAAAIQAMLVSPHFLFRVERDPRDVPPGTAYRVTDLDLASRLSFFLWSSIPDEELLALAEQGRLKDPVIIDQQVQRMLADPRGKGLASNFAEQWLSLRKLRIISPDPIVFPDFDDNLRDAFEQETEQFVDSILRENRSVLDLLNADYTFLNERLARHYGVPDVFGSDFRRVILADEQRRGLLGHGSLLAATSYANRTAPTLRGAWILENLLGTPPPPPPPDVPSLPEGQPGHTKPMTMRERMDEHKSNVACANCHRLMDPLGFALENFDALGRWRASDAGVPIDSSGTLPDGARFEGPAGLRDVLLSNPEQFVHTFTEKLLTYALGRGVEYYDAPTIRAIMRSAAADGYRLRALIAGIVKSAPFQMRRSGPS